MAWILRIGAFLVLTFAAQVESVSWHGLAHVIEKAKAAVRPTLPDAGPLGSQPVGEYQRKTQSPLVTISLHKQTLPVPTLSSE